MQNLFFDFQFLKNKFFSFQINDEKKLFYIKNGTN